MANPDHPTFSSSSAPAKPLLQHSRRGLLRMELEKGSPGFCQFALNNACNARCGFCNFALDKLPRASWKYVDRGGALDAIDILSRQSVRYLSELIRTVSVAAHK